jgi:rRNA-processing protein CGR1
MVSLHTTFKLRPYPNSAPGKQWHEPKTAFRPKAGSSSFEKRQEERKAMAVVKAKEKEMKDEKEAEKQVRYG